MNIMQSVTKSGNCIGILIQLSYFLNQILLWHWLDCIKLITRPLPINIRIAHLQRVFKAVLKFSARPPEILSAHEIFVEPVNFKTKQLSSSNFENADYNFQVDQVESSRIVLVQREIYELRVRRLIHIIHSTPLYKRIPF